MTALTLISERRARLQATTEDGNLTAEPYAVGGKYRLVPVLVLIS